LIALSILRINPPKFDGGLTSEPLRWQNVMPNAGIGQKGAFFTVPMLWYRNITFYFGNQRNINKIKKIKFVALNNAN
jgi:hypothetical protein